MFRAPIWMMSAYSTTMSTWRGSMTSVTTGIPNRSPVALRIFRPSSPSPLKAIRAGPGLEGPPSEDVGPGVLDRLGDLDEPGFALDGAGAGDHHQVAAADADTLDVEDRVASGWNSRLASLNGLVIGTTALDPLDRLERLGLDFLFIADHADDGPHYPPAQVGRQPKLLDPGHDVADHLVGWVRLQDDDHRVPHDLRPTIPVGLPTMSGNLIERNEPNGVRASRESKIITTSLVGR